MPRVVGYGRTVLVQTEDFERLIRLGLVRRSNVNERAGYPTSTRAARLVADGYPLLADVRPANEPAVDPDA